MKLTLQTQLLPDESQGEKLKATVERFNEAANWLAGEAFERKLANKIALQKLYYHSIFKFLGFDSEGLFMLPFV